MKLNIGCGDRLIDGWVNVDQQTIDDVEPCNVRFLSNKYGKETAEIIYASHVLEYFDEREVIDILKEWRKVLIPGGILRLSVPNIESLIQVYQETGSIANIIGPMYGRIETDYGCLYHKAIYDYKTLGFLMRVVGFRAIRKWDWRTTEHSYVDDGSQAYFPHMDKENGLLMSLNIEGTK